MRVTKYNLLLNEEQHPYLVKEQSENCPEVSAMNSPRNIKDVMDRVFKASFQAEEHVWVIALNAKCKPLGIFEVSHGIADASFLGCREVFTRLMLCGAVQFTIIHNHLSGDVSPSIEDINSTKKFVEAGKMMGIRLCDHIILGQDDYYSFYENGMMKEETK